MTRSLWLYATVSLAAALVVLLGLRLLRDYPWVLASFSGLGLGVLVLMTLLTIDRLRRQVREERERRLRR
ncbi:MAG TPA: hypothetical protein VMT85_05420 [Thermoanaerobaculia bacterium]|nr:hypothetical protein [Thermoanaerobaculia bacterium]